ncbi:hypothetical protein ebA2144 [Aromatoleum aromaticum EbN1]|uniref:Uncharacterized protein n=1 Tax=Aromatoleum aromaticum (strain DSM 19018 / LMG 30748 / EbN1) TaxID=76114 RepID=Q5P5U8_AROAE|nr:hypothetical protein ebA2144 [Aromatoleum aromaticum EbN1]
MITSMLQDDRKVIMQGANYTRIRLTRRRQTRMSRGHRGPGAAARGAHGSTLGVRASWKCAFQPDM